VTPTKPSLETAAKVMEDPQFRRAYEKAQTSYLEGPQPKQEVVLTNDSKDSKAVFLTTQGQDTIRFRLKHMDGKQQWFIVDKSMTVDNFKTCLSDGIGMSALQLRLVFHGSGCTDNQTFAELKIQDGETMHLLMQITGS